jgi:hypothetical protein
VRDEGGRGKKGTDRTCLRPWVGKRWTKAACRRWHRTGGGCGDGGGTPVRKRARGTAVQLRGEVEKVVGGSV